MKHYIKFSTLLTLLLLYSLFITSATVAQDIPKANPEQFFVSDSANILSHESSKELNTLSQGLMDASSAQVKTVTIKSLDGETPEAFAFPQFIPYQVCNVELRS